MSKLRVRSLSDSAESLCFLAPARILLNHFFPSRIPPLLPVARHSSSSPLRISLLFVGHSSGLLHRHLWMFPGLYSGLPPSLTGSYPAPCGCLSLTSSGSSQKETALVPLPRVFLPSLCSLPSSSCFTTTARVSLSN